MDQNDNLLEILRKFSKFLKNFLLKIVKIHYFSIFFKSVNKLCVNFLRVWTKNPNCWKFWEKFEIFWWKFYRKIEFFYFLFFFENLLLKIELSEITPFFYNNFFQFRGNFGGNFPPFPLATPLLRHAPCGCNRWSLNQALSSEKCDGKFTKTQIFVIHIRLERCRQEQTSRLWDDSQDFRPMVGHKCAPAHEWNDISLPPRTVPILHWEKSFHQSIENTT